MKVKELIELFTPEDMEKEVYVASDAEGNDYSKLTDVSNQICVNEKGGYVSVFNEDEPEEYKDSSYEDVIVLWRV